MAKINKSLKSISPAAPGEQHFVDIHRDNVTEPLKSANTDAIVAQDKAVKVFDRKKNHFGHDMLDSIKVYDEAEHTDHKKRHVFIDGKWYGVANARNNREAIKQGKAILKAKGDHDGNVKIVKESPVDIARDSLYEAMKSFFLIAEDDVPSLHPFRKPKNPAAFVPRGEIQDIVNKYHKNSTEDQVARDIERRIKKGDPTKSWGTFGEILAKAAIEHAIEHHRKTRNVNERFLSSVISHFGPNDFDTAMQASRDFKKKASAGRIAGGTFAAYGNNTASSVLRKNSEHNSERAKHYEDAAREFAKGNHHAARKHIAAALDVMDEGEINELSTGLLKRYAKKAAGSAAQKAHDAGYDERGPFRSSSQKNLRKAQHRIKGVKTAINKISDRSIVETLAPDATAADYIHDFVHSDNEKFKGKSKKERIKMALGAYYAKNEGEVIPITRHMLYKMRKSEAFMNVMNKNKEAQRRYKEFIGDGSQARTGPNASLTFDKGKVNERFEHNLPWVKSLGDKVEDDKKKRIEAIKEKILKDKKK